MTLLRPYQDEALSHCRAAYRAGQRRILLVSPVGSGKTSMGSAILSRALHNGRRCKWTAHREELVGQALVRLLRSGVDPALVGVVQAGVREVHTPTPPFNPSLPDRDLLSIYRVSRPAAPLQVCSVQTLIARGEAPEADAIVIDEAHHVAAPTWTALLGAYPRLELLLGLTATPERGDGRGLDAFQTLIEATTVEALTRDGYLVPADVIAPAEPRRELAARPVDAWRRHAPGALTVVFCRGVAHAAATAAEFNAAGIAAGLVTGTTRTEDRERTLADFAAGRLRVVCNVDVLTEGWDCPAVSCVLMARRAGTWGVWMQGIGRALRPAAGKARATILDPYGLVYQHGLPTDRRTFSLTGGSSAVAQPIPVRQCRSCGAAFRSAVACPRCGWVPPPPPPPKVKPTEMQRVEALSRIPDDVKRRKLAEWRREGREKGWKVGAVEHRFRGAFGHPVPRGW